MPSMFAACRTDEGDAAACPPVLATKDELPAEAFNRLLPMLRLETRTRRLPSSWPASSAAKK